MIWNLCVVDVIAVVNGFCVEVYDSGWICNIFIWMWHFFRLSTPVALYLFCFMSLFDFLKSPCPTATPKVFPFRVSRGFEEIIGNLCVCVCVCVCIYIYIQTNWTPYFTLIYYVLVGNCRNVVESYTFETFEAYEGEIFILKLNELHIIRKIRKSKFKFENDDMNNDNNNNKVR
jgi:hypothetical protein